MNASTFVYILALWSVLDEVLVTNMTFERTLSLATQKIVPAKDVLQHPWSHECHFRIFRMSRIFLSLENRHFWFWKKIAFVLFKTFWYQLVQWMVGTVDQWLQVLLPTFSRLWCKVALNKLPKPGPVLKMCKCIKCPHLEANIFCNFRVKEISFTVKRP